MEVAPKLDGCGLVRGGPSEDSGLTSANHFGIGDGVIVRVELAVRSGDAHVMDSGAVVGDVEGNRLPGRDGELFGLKKIFALGYVEGAVGPASGRLSPRRLRLPSASYRQPHSEGQDGDGQETWEIPFQRAFHHDRR